MFERMHTRTHKRARIHASYIKALMYALTHTLVLASTGTHSRRGSGVGTRHAHSKAHAHVSIHMHVRILVKEITGG